MLLYLKPMCTKIQIHIFMLFCYSVTRLCPVFCDPMICSMPGSPVLHYLLEFAQIHVQWFSKATYAAPISCLQSFPAPGSFCIRWQKQWSFSFSISPTTEYSGLISFRTDWFDLLAIKGFSKVFSRTTIQKCRFFGTQPSLWPNSQIWT